ncbi:AMP-fatty acid ligase [Photobacterium jeanii]|uniref:AMP-fatty acid ligase n=1 Tax=Photobacterium jeanii TaxID=858640 RepID=A0A178K2Q4_9GAMM|nr:AMP-binding protein [Photobacterium jeanii]OAN11013.1 AMP-fatty acid ligase [Photobacterium jeanii]PST90528.1 AMP-fatty acid ligase [Photobacterium jeanii]
MNSSSTYHPLADLMMSPRANSAIVAIDDASQDAVTWLQFTQDVASLTAFLQQRPEARWAVCFADSYHFAVALMALAHSNKHIILPGNHQPAALAALADKFDALLHDAEVDAIAGLPSVTLPLANADATDITFRSLPLSQCPVTLFTSGSSGTPKAIEKTLAGIAAELDVLEQVWGEKITDSHIVSTVSHQHIYGLLFRLLWPLCSGRSFSRFDLIYPEQVVAHASANITLISSPALLKRLTGMVSEQSFRHIFSSGGPLPHPAALQSQALFSCLPTEVFGSTETGGIGYRQQQQPTTPWQLFPCHQVELNAEQCLRIQSPFIDGIDWYQTSDQCDLLPERQFMLKGRADRVVKIEEKRISLVEVEQRLTELEWIDEAAVLPLDEGHRLILGAVITLTAAGEAQLTAQGKGKLWLAIRQQLRQWLEPVGIPRRYRAVDEIPLNSQGKRQFQALVDLFAE